MRERKGCERGEEEVDWVFFFFLFWNRGWVFEVDELAGGEPVD